ncbi:hypothetical protein GUITHDRAFT_108557 [Guillardia theta CCMP2712]|uniref:Uncharacterized protein n=1 Tax=Guillardia theta (strain CCMP2712) TaxID=905079 RepID=L1JBJ2_GUITC|nr:hypothetical protein GUITHDRAFT_108557 [Guillardia theta CCMP2712]EKX45682.1 hypothetical protein GUITHDRAFT_108557 [Guillardia theta CCMP2712]|eukprot:XP_005832662.1 hypothetical protein GUITHDRAFT_108557 [Guillardia theta CCMP2712]
MVRPSASDYNKRIGLTFANTIAYEQVKRESGGYCSVYSLLKICCPTATRSEDPLSARHGMTEIEFNKLLEHNGFYKVRSRRSFLDRHDDWTPRGESSAPSPLLAFVVPSLMAQLTRLLLSPVRYMYAARRWRNPALPEDRARLVEGWELLVSNAGPFLATQCPLDRFLDLCQQARCRWEAFANGAPPLDVDASRAGLGHGDKLAAEDGHACTSHNHDNEDEDVDVDEDDVEQMAQGPSSFFPGMEGARTTPPVSHEEERARDGIDAVLDDLVSSGIAPVDIEEYLEGLSVEDGLGSWCPPEHSMSVYGGAAVTGRDGELFESVEMLWECREMERQHGSIP